MVLLKWHNRCTALHKNMQFFSGHLSVRKHFNSLKLLKSIHQSLHIQTSSKLLHWKQMLQLKGLVQFYLSCRMVIVYT